MSLTNIILSKVLGVDLNETERLKKELATANTRMNITTFVPKEYYEDPRYVVEDKPNYPFPVAIRTYQLFNGRWEYEILENGVVVIHQDFEPGSQGWIPMTEETALEYAKTTLQNRLDAYAQKESG